MSEPYPPHWVADVVLADGGTVHIRPITPDDAARLVDFHHRLSPRTVYYRFFAPYPELSDRDVARFTTVDYTDRLALVALLGDDLVGVARYDRAPGTDEAEVAFTVADEHQGRGLGSVLLEHLGADADERGIRRFTAETLADNRRMISVFRDAGWEVERTYADGQVHLRFPIEPTTASMRVMRAREQHAEAASVIRLLRPRSVAVVGASRTPGTVGDAVLRHLLAAGFTGPVYPVNPYAVELAGRPAYPTVRHVPDDVDLAVVAVPAGQVADVVKQCAAKGVHGLVVVSAGFAETGEPGWAAERELVERVRRGGMRLVGPNCLGIANTDPEVLLNASLAPTLPPPGRVGMFSQSGALGAAILDSVRARGLGLSTFVSAGNRADVSGNDLLQYWEGDTATEVVLLYLESFGNPRKFARLARRLARRKPIVAVNNGGAVPPGHPVTGAALPPGALDALFRQAGVIRVTTLAQLLDVGVLLAHQPLPAGRRVAIVGNSAALGLLAADACASHDLDVAGDGPVDLGPGSGPAHFRAALRAALDADDVDAVVCVFVPPLSSSGVSVAPVLAELAVGSVKPVVSTFLAVEGVPPLLRRGEPAGRGSVPSYPSPEVAVQALAAAADYADWLRRPPGELPLLDVDSTGAREWLHRVLADHPEGDWLAAMDVAALLDYYGVPVWPTRPVSTADEAVDAAGQLGWPVALKVTVPALRHRLDLGGVRLDLASAAELRLAFRTMRDRVGDEGGVDLGFVVQAMAPPGVATVIGTQEHAAFGTLISFGVGGVAVDLLGDRAFRILPLTDHDAGELVRSVRAAPLLFGYRGGAPVDVPALESLLLRVGQLADDLPEVAELRLNPVVVGREGTAVLDASVRLVPTPARGDAGPRRLRVG